AHGRPPRRRRPPPPRRLIPRVRQAALDLLTETPPGAWVRDRKSEWGPTYGSRLSATRAVKACASRAVTGPGADGSARPSTAEMACTSLVLEVMKASSAPARADRGRS